MIKTESKYTNNIFIDLPAAGDVITKPTWGKDQPNNYNGEQNCVVLDGGREWLWNDVGCNLDYLHWICQYSEFVHITCNLIQFVEIYYTDSFKKLIFTRFYI